jgi:hypothetical protein
MTVIKLSKNLRLSISNFHLRLGVLRTGCRFGVSNSRQLILKQLTASGSTTPDFLSVGNLEKIWLGHQTACTIYPGEADKNASCSVSDLSATKKTPLQRHLAM